MAEEYAPLRIFCAASTLCGLSDTGSSCGLELPNPARDALSRMLGVASGPLALTPEIDELRRQFEQASADADVIVTDLRDEQFNWRPALDAWSIAECLDHLNATARNYLPALDEAIAEAIRKGVYGIGPFRYAWLGSVIVRLCEPPPPFRVRSPRLFLPAPNRARNQIMAAHRAYQVQFIDRLRQANGLDLGRVRVRAPMNKWLRFSLGSGFAFMAAHERRHLWQARQIIAMKGFPAA